MSWLISLHINYLNRLCDSNCFSHNQTHQTLSQFPLLLLLFQPCGHISKSVNSSFSRLDLLDPYIFAQFFFNLVRVLFSFFKIFYLSLFLSLFLHHVPLSLSLPSLIPYLDGTHIFKNLKRVQRACLLLRTSMSEKV